MLKMNFDLNEEAAPTAPEFSNGMNNNINTTTDANANTAMTMKMPSPSVRARASSGNGNFGEEADDHVEVEDDFISRTRLNSKTSTPASHHDHQLQDTNININLPSASVSATTSASISNSNESQSQSQSALTQRPNIVNFTSPRPSSSPATTTGTRIHNNNSSAQENAFASSASGDGSSSINHTTVNAAININTLNTSLDAASKVRDNSNINPSQSQSQRRNPPPPQLIFSSETPSPTPPPLPISHPPTVGGGSRPSSTSKVEFVLGDDDSDRDDADNMKRLLRKTSAIRSANNSSHNHNSSGELMMTNGFELPGPGSGTTTPTLLSAEENFECYADGRDSFFDSPSETASLQYATARDAADLSLSETAGPSNRATPTSGLPFRRNSALRTSLRKSPQDGLALNGDMGHRRWGSFRNTSGTKRPLGTSTPTSSNALASQLYRTGSFNSTGRSSTGDAEEMYSDGSLEDEVIDLTQKVHHLEEKFTVLAENQSDVDDRYTRAKQENSELSTKLFLLEEQLRDVEQRAEDKIRDEQKRSKEALARLDREKQLQIENYDIRLQSLEKELQQTKAEATRQKQQLERERSERIQASDKLFETEREIVSLRDDNRTLVEQARKERESLVAETAGSQQALQDLRKEFENLRQFQMANMNGSLSRGHNQMHRDSLDGDVHEIRSRLLELEEQNKQLKQQNRHLEETNEDLTAQILNRGLEEGRHLLTLGPRDMGNSLAAEFEAMSEDQMKSALKEQKEVNEQLRCYIDGILLNIVENYPQLLEVKNKSSHSTQPQSARQEQRRES